MFISAVVLHIVPCADGSLLLCVDEQSRTENGIGQDAFSKRTSNLTKQIASTYRCSVADALAVCAMTMTTELGAPDLLKLAPLRVGRIDNANCDPAGQLPSNGVSTHEAVNFFTARGLDARDAIALLGVHSLVASKGCVT